MRPSLSWKLRNNEVPNKPLDLTADRSALSRRSASRYPTGVAMKVEHKRIWVKGLLIDCIFGESLDNCPVKELRLLPIEERLDRADSMLEQELDNIIEFHKSCLGKRDGRRPDFYG